MTKIDAGGLDFRALNERIRNTAGDAVIENCLGQRFLGAGMGEKKLLIRGVPGNALGAYLNGASIEVSGNAQDAVGDTMNEGMILVHGSIGDTAGYAMRGGRIYVEGNAGYRTGIHMKAYKEHVPVIIIGGRAGSFLGEYLAGGMICVLGLHTDGRPIVSNFPCAGMHGGKLFLRSDCEGLLFPDQVTVRRASEKDLEELMPSLAEYCGLCGLSLEKILCAPFSVVTPDSRNPYKQMYVVN